MKENLIYSGKLPYSLTVYEALLHMDWVLMQSTHEASVLLHHFSSLLKTILKNKDSMSFGRKNSNLNQEDRGDMFYKMLITTNTSTHGITNKYTTKVEASSLTCHLVVFE
jgi:hypothetical protein